MRWVPSAFVLWIGTVICMEENSNGVVIGTSIKPPNLDANLRKALLKALIDLENDDQDNFERNTPNDYVNIITRSDYKAKNVDKASASALSYITTSEPVNMTITVKKTTSKPKHTVIVQKSRDPQHKIIYDDDDLDLSETPEHFIASASSSFTSNKEHSEKPSTLRRTSGEPLIFNSLTSGVREKKPLFEQTTTVRPTTSTEESEANVESLQFFSAPLVAAFTVHQDDKGLPKSVVPIYKTLEVSTSTTGKHLEKKKERDRLNHEVSEHQEITVRYEEQLRQKQRKLEEEIRRLRKLQEEQGRIIREQKLAYEKKLLEQHKKLFQEQTRLFNNVQPFVPILTTTPKPIFYSLNQPNNIEHSKDIADTIVSIQPSVGFVQASTPFSLNAQMLPVKNAIDFRTPFWQNFRHLGVHDSIVPNLPQLTSFSKPVNAAVPLAFTVRNFPSAHTTQNPVVTFGNSAHKHNFLQALPSIEHRTVFKQNQPVVHTFSTSQNVPFASIQGSFRNTEIIPQQVTRSLRQEIGTGNFLNNNRLNSPADSFDLFTDHRFNRDSLSSVAMSKPTQFTRSNSFGSAVFPAKMNQYNTLQYSVDEPFVNQRLNDLLYFSGLSQGRQQEDLNIVSKVLSLNHLGSGESQFASSNVDSRKMRPLTSWRVL